MSLRPGVLAGALGLLLFAVAGSGHVLPLPPPASPDAARLGMDAAELKALAGDALQPGLLSRKEVPAPDSGLTAFHRRFSPTSDLAYAEYELFRGKVYRVRWRLAERFERPLIHLIVDRMVHRLGPPLYDQMVKAEFGASEASLRRVAWKLSRGTIEVRQLEPQPGGPLYLTWMDQEAIDSILDARLVVPSQPDQVPPWWEGKPKSAQPLTEGEEEPLLEGFEALLASWLQAGSAPAKNLANPSGE